MRARVYFSTMVLMFAGACGNPERTEAVRFAKVLQQQQQVLNESISREPAVIEGVKQWSGMVAFLGGGGAGGDPSLRAQEFASVIKREQDQIAGVRVSLESEQLKFAPTQTIRTNVVQSLRTREDYLGRIISSLNQSAEAFPRMNGFSYPRSIADLNQQVSAYTPSSTTIPDAIQSLRIQYKITDGELASAP